MRLRSKPPCVIVDLDGTLCDVTHRLQWLSAQPKNWAAWNAGIPSDPPHSAVVDVVRHLGEKFPIIIVSGRSEDNRQVTEKWLERHDVRYSAMYMRGADDFRPDHVIKAEIAEEIESTHDVLCVFDDRPSVVAMWRERGHFVFDCNQSGADF